MKKIIALLFLLPFLAYSERFIQAFNSGQVAGLTSFSHDPNTDGNGGTQNHFAVIFEAITGAPPIVSAAFAEGSASTGGGQINYQGSIAALAWYYDAVGEYCELNGVPGYQAVGDTLIQAYNYASATWEPVVATGPSNTGVYTASMSDTTGLFTLTCRLGTTDRLDSGINIDAFSLKCDVTVNATNMQNVFSLCPDNKRYVGLMAFIAAAEVDISGSANTNNDTYVGTSITMNSGKSFFKWKETFENSATGTSYPVNAQVQNYGLSVPGNSLAVVRKVIFSFLSPKSETSVYFWDPQVGFDQAAVAATSGASSLTAIFSMALLAVAALVL